MSTTVINILKDEHDDDDPNFVYIGRRNNRLGHAESKWKNPFVEDKDGTREEVVQMHKDWIVTQPELMAALHEIKGKVLGCYCHPLACHGHYLAELADSLTTEKESTMEKYSDFRIHPAADVFPMLDDKSYQALKADIAANGQWEMIMMHDEQIIDGRNRLKACCELGIEPSIGELPIDLDPCNYIVGVNLHRRHLDKGQRSMIADKLATMRQGEKKADTGIPVSPPSQAEAAAMLNVSVDSVQKARTVRNNATPEVVAAVERGELSLNAAVETVKPKTTSSETPAAPRPPKPEAKSTKRSLPVDDIKLALMRMKSSAKRRAEIIEVATFAWDAMNIEQKREFFSLATEKRQSLIDRQQWY